MLELEQLTKLGFGSYRISVRSTQHKEALVCALEAGLNLIDTSANYTDGDSEKLIGEVLSETQKKAFVVTKAGYIQGSNLERIKKLNSEGKAKQDLVDISPQLKHSIHPDFLRDQIDLSLSRLDLNQIDGHLLHNPEYFFDDPSLGPDEQENANKYYERIKKAFCFLEEMVKKGKIRYYGISSNTLPFPKDDKKATQLERVFEAAKAVSSSHHFKLIQFPYNLVENQAKEVLQNDHNLISLAKSMGLKTLSNRPLNAFYDNSLLRLATYDDQEFEEDDAWEIFEICMNLVLEKWVFHGGTKREFYEVPLVQQFKEVWGQLKTPDAVDQVFQIHFFPFISRLWGQDGIPPKQAKPFFLLYDTAIFMAKRNLTLKALEFRKEMEDNGQLSKDPEKTFPQIACQSYLDDGIDHVLVGMRSTDYVKDLSSLL